MPTIQLNLRRDSSDTTPVLTGLAAAAASKHDRVGLIIGASIGAAIVACCVSIIIWDQLRRHKARRQEVNILQGLEIDRGCHRNKMGGYSESQFSFELQEQGITQKKATEKFEDQRQMALT